MCSYVEHVSPCISRKEVGLVFNFLRMRWVDDIFIILVVWYVEALYSQCLGSSRRVRDKQTNLDREADYYFKACFAPYQEHFAMKDEPPDIFVGFHVSIDSSTAVVRCWPHNVNSTFLPSCIKRA